MLTVFLKRRMQGKERKKNHEKGRLLLAIMGLLRN